MSTRRPQGLWFLGPGSMANNGALGRGWEARPCPVSSVIEETTVPKYALVRCASSAPFEWADADERALLSRARAKAREERSDDVAW